MLQTRMLRQACLRLVANSGILSVKRTPATKFVQIPQLQNHPVTATFRPFHSSFRHDFRSEPDLSNSENVSDTVISTPKRDITLRILKDRTTQEHFVKIQETTNRNGKSSSIFMGQSDLEEFIQLLSASQTSDRGSSCQIKSSTFKGKRIKVSFFENDFGRFVEIQEFWDQGPRSEHRFQPKVIVPDEIIQELTGRAKKVHSQLQLQGTHGTSAGVQQERTATAEPREMRRDANSFEPREVRRNDGAKYVRNMQASDEIFTTNLSTSRRSYWFNLKQEIATNKCFVKLREVSNNKSASIFLGLVDLDDFIRAVSDVESAPPSRDPYCQLKSKMFEDKVYKFVLMKNNFGKYLEIIEVYEGGLQQGMSTRIVVADDDKNFLDFLTRLEDVRDHAKQLWTSIQTNELS